MESQFRKITQENNVDEMNMFVISVWEDFEFSIFVDFTWILSSSF